MTVWKRIRPPDAILNLVYDAATGSFDFVWKGVQYWSHQQVKRLCRVYRGRFPEIGQKLRQRSSRAVKTRGIGRGYKSGPREEV